MYSRLPIEHSASRPFTDYSRWRLLVSEGGRHTWHYLKTDEECAQWPQNAVDKYWLGMKLNLPPLSPAKNPLAAARNGYRFYKNLQSHDGHWPGEYGGPMFLLPGLVIGSYVSGMGFKLEERMEMIRYLMNRAHPQDGGWGIHVEGHSTVFGTGLNYTALRILGMEADHPVCTKARATLHRLGGAAASPAWGKFWLSLLNVYDWAGNNPVPPELWLLPDWLPFHPHRWWIHTRTVYVPMSYLYGVRFKMPENDLILALREELYPENYYSIDWPAQRNNVSKADLYAPHTAVFDMINVVLGGYESCPLPPLRRAAVARAYELIVLEDENTGYQTLGPVSKMFNLVARAYQEGPESEAYRLHQIKRDDFMWIGKEGMMMCGTNGSQLWDVGFITQALVETGLADENKESLIKALEWLDESQMLDDPKHYKTAYRHTTKGAWGFSTREQGYVVSDCTGEGLKALISDRRIFDAVDVLLTLQNPNGGSKWLELLNPAEVFGNLVHHDRVLLSWCTTSVITSLAIFRKHYLITARTIKSAIVYLHTCQQSEGGWIGSWESVHLAKQTYATSDSSRRACNFCLENREPTTCEVGSWVEHADSQVVQTCWAVMSLMCFNKTCAIA
ncbi:terpenoid cyclases/protein prenyltransferase alpha-alpha toroid [Mycena sp. CBHHK59/15]|nr:terpenoid cyclases/protein prenyltransferase alpha-alpha toroid [Mycena sp. CBHHK59/15]